MEGDPEGGILASHPTAEARRDDCSMIRASRATGSSPGTRAISKFKVPNFVLLRQGDPAILLDRERRTSLGEGAVGPLVVRGGDGFMGARRLILSLLGAMLGVLVFASSSALAVEGHVFSSSFGKAGSGAGEMMLREVIPGQAGSGVAVDDATHDVYVADTGNARVDEFEADGAFVRAWGWGVADGLAKAETCTLVCEKGLEGSGAGQLTAPTFVAIDNSGGPSEGDVYVGDSGTNVVSKFSAAGVFLSSNDGSTATTPIVGPFTRLAGIAVDGDGDLWVSDGAADTFEFAADGSFVTDWQSRSGEFSGIAVDSSGDLDVVAGSGVVRVSPSGEEIGNVQEGFPTGLAVDSASGDLFVDGGRTISRFPPACEPALGLCIAADTFGSGVLRGGAGVGVDPADDEVYVAETSADAIDSFKPALLPGVVSGEVTNLVAGAATLTGTVEPEGEAVTSCEFEYVADSEYEASATNPYAKGGTASCEPSPTTDTVSVQAKVKSLAPGTLYHYRLVAANNNGEEVGVDRTFTGGASIDAESVSTIASGEATVEAQIDAHGLGATYRVEYGTGSDYGSSTEAASLGAPSGDVGVAVKLVGLQPGAEYHFRFVTVDSFASIAGGDMTFTTPQSTGPVASILPDERAYELVSPAGNPGEVYVPQGGNVEAGYPPPEEDVQTEHLFRASESGNSVTYDGDPAAAGGSGSIGKGEGDEFLASREPGGWTAEDIQPPGSVSRFENYQGLSSDLSLEIIKSEGGLASDATGKCEVLYSRLADGQYEPLFTPAPGSAGCIQRPVYAGASADGSDLLLESQAAFTAEVGEAKGPCGTGIGGSERRPQCDLYISVEGQLSSVNRLPDGEPAPNATFGGLSESYAGGSLEYKAPDFEHVISNSGADVFWTDLEAGPDMGHVFVRENPTQPQSPVGAGGECTTPADACTRPVSLGGARYWTASTDGRYVVYSEGEKLFRFALESGTREELTGAGAEFDGVVGASDDGSYIYFTAEGVLSGNANGEQETATAGEPNLYLLHVGEAVKFIGVLRLKDNELPGPVNHKPYGDWQAFPGARTAEVTPDGHHLVFESTAGLTKSNKNVGQVQIFTYSADGGQLSCASCSPDGRPDGGGEATLSLSFNATFMHRWISDDGSRVFFDAAQSLVPQDTNGQQDVYEWEQEGTTGCPVESSARPNKGCVSLLSDGKSTDYSYLADASASGNDVFFVTRGQLVPQDQNEKMDLYDARVDGGFPDVKSGCTGSGCQGVPPAPPIFATPSSVTFSGVGNLEPPPVTAAKSKPKPKKCKRGFALKRGKCVKGKAKKTRHVTKKAKHVSMGVKRGRKS
jgi:hypothetical protein